ncbi:MAG: rane protein [Micavibrio sp.]|nr:rane protein [Micavibrio sp.]
MAEIIYMLCAGTAFVCAWLLMQAYYRSRYKLLLWGGLCFIGITINNILLVLDKIYIHDMDLSSWRLLTALMAMMILLYGLIWNTE